MVELSKTNAARGRRHASKATFVKADLFETDFSKATVITMFLLPQINMKLRPKILDMKPGTRIVSNTFTMEDWEPDETAIDRRRLRRAGARRSLDRAGARSRARGRCRQGELTLTQTFQMI